MSNPSPDPTADDKSAKTLEWLERRRQRDMTQRSKPQDDPNSDPGDYNEEEWADLYPIFHEDW